MKKNKINIPIIVILIISTVVLMVPVVYLLLIALTPHKELFTRLIPKIV